jgi:hypothetical protein
MTNQAINKSFIIHKDSLSVLNKLTDEQAGKLFKAIFDYQINNVLPEDTLTSIIFEPFLNQFKRDDVKYQNVVERNKINGSKGGRPKTQENPLGYLATQKNPEEPRKADSKNKSDSDSDSDSKNDNNSKNDSNLSNNINIKNKRFTKPTIQELISFCNEFALNIDPQQFIDYYEANGWKINKNPMKDWQATARNWHRRSAEKITTTTKSKVDPMSFTPSYDYEF